MVQRSGTAAICVRVRQLVGECTSGGSLGYGQAEEPAWGLGRGAALWSTYACYGHQKVHPSTKPPKSIAEGVPIIVNLLRAPPVVRAMDGDPVLARGDYGLSLTD